jgi:hypothetical protein
MEKLKKQLDKLIQKLENAENFKATLQDLVSVYPFSEYEYIISHLLAQNKLTLKEYHDLRSSYIDRNRYLRVFEITAPRRLGDTWAVNHLKELAPEFKKANKRFDPNYANQKYDLWLEYTDKLKEKHGIRIEIKTARALDKEKPGEPSYIKALYSDSNKPYDLIFEQIKSKFTDVFIWIAVWRDKIRYWVLSSDEVKNCKNYSDRQHAGNIGEGQLHLNRENISEFNNFEVKSTDIKEAVIRAYKKQKKIKG